MKQEYRCLFIWKQMLIHVVSRRENVGILSTLATTLRKDLFLPNPGDVSRKQNILGYSLSLRIVVVQLITKNVVGWFSWNQNIHFDNCKHIVLVYFEYVNSNPAT